MRLNLQLFAKKVDDSLVQDVINGKYGNGGARKTALANAGYDYSEVQSLVNAKLNGTSPTTLTSNVPTTTPITTTNAYYGAEPQKPGDFTYDPYQSNWQPYIEDTLKKILNREKFSYDLNGDALYQQYKDQYTTQGKLASMDVMGQAAAMTGGYDSSYTETAGHQAYQGYLQQLNDKVPELYQLALSQYNQEGQDLKDQYALYADMDEREYGRHIDDLNMRYGMHRDDVADWQYETELEYRRNRDAIADAETKRQYAYDTAMAMLNLGVMPSPQMLKDAGISSADAKAIIAKIKKNEKKATQYSSSNNPKPTPTPKPAPAPTGFNGSTYEEAVAYLKKNGVPSGSAAGMMTQSEWARRKASYEANGTGGAEVKNYSSYAEYIRAYVEYQIQKHGK